MLGSRAYQRLEVGLANGLVPAEDGAHAYRELRDGDRAAAVPVEVLEALLLGVGLGVLLGVGLGVRGVLLGVGLGVRGGSRVTTG